MTEVASIAEAIASGEITEGQTVDFKSRIDLKDLRDKETLLRTVVAFLNRNAAHIYVGVREGKKHLFERFEPYEEEDRDKACRQAQSVIMDSIEPRPTKIAVRSIEVEGGFILDIDIPEHRMRPYLNKATGAFHIRTGNQNDPMSRDAIKALFTPWDRYKEDAAGLMKREREALAQRDPAPPVEAVYLHIAIIPGEHYEDGKDPFLGYLAPHRPAMFQHWDKGYVGTFSVSESGMETITTNFDGRPVGRFFVGADWTLHSFVAYPITGGPERVTIGEFRGILKDHMNQIADFADEQGLQGPFAVLMAMDGLNRDPKVAWVFPNVPSKAMPKAEIVERINDEALVDKFAAFILASSRYRM